MPKYRKLYTRVLESSDFNSLETDFEKLTWVLLPLVVCREGRGIFNGTWLKSKLYPLNSNVTEDDVLQAMREFEERGMIRGYYDLPSDRRYFQLVNWFDYQGNTSREAESPYPAPSGDGHEEVVTNSRSNSNANSNANANANANATESTSDPVYELSESKPDRMVSALSEVTGIDADIPANRTKLENTATQLLPKYSADYVLTRYGVGGDWWEHHWKGQKGQQPTLTDVTTTIGTKWPKVVRHDRQLTGSDAKSPTLADDIFSTITGEAPY